MSRPAPKEEIGRVTRTYEADANGTRYRHTVVIGGKTVAAEYHVTNYQLDTRSIPVYVIDRDLEQQVIAHIRKDIYG